MFFFKKPEQIVEIKNDWKKYSTRICHDYKPAAAVGRN